MKLTKSLISKNISLETDINAKDARSITEKFIKLIKDKSNTNTSVKISGFGTFYFRRTPKRIGRNPKTKDSYIIPSLLKLSFKASNMLRKKLN